MAGSSIASKRDTILLCLRALVGALQSLRAARNQNTLIGILNLPCLYLSAQGKELIWMGTAHTSDEQVPLNRLSVRVLYI